MRIEFMKRSWFLVAAVCSVSCFASLQEGACAQDRESLIDVASYRSLVADHKGYRVGDVLTVYVQETTRAKSQAATDASSRLEMDAALRSISTDYGANLGIVGSNASGAQTTRLGELRTQLSVRVTAVEPNGDLRIEGGQQLVVNGERQRIYVTGLVRAEDISAENAVWSNRIANAHLELDGVGVVSASQRQSLLYRLFKWLRLI